MEWDTKYLDFYDIAERHEESHAVNFNLYYDGELSDTLWTQII
jgi:hypothetical protein